MDKTILGLIEKAGMKYKEVGLLSNPVYGSVQITNYVFSDKVKIDTLELGVLAAVSRFNIPTSLDERLETMAINFNIINESFESSKKGHKDYIKSSLDTLAEKEVIEIVYTGDKPESDKDRYDKSFKVFQRFSTRDEMYSEEDWSVFNEVSDLDESRRSRSSTSLYITDIEKILAMKETPTNTLKLLAVYASICKPIFFYDPKVVSGKSKKRSPSDETRLAVNWEKMSVIGQRAGFGSLPPVRKLIRVLVENKVIARMDVGFNGRSVYNTRTYLSRYLDARVLTMFVIHQIRQGVVQNIFSNNYTEKED